MTNKRKILLVDDDPIGSQLLCEKLKNQGFDITLETDESQTREHILSGEYSIILLDVIFPNTSGLTILKDIREDFDPIDLPVIMITSKDKNEDIIEALNIGANDYLTKPVNSFVAAARISTQLNMIYLNQKNLKSAELSAVHTMVVTYNHEINNPLTIALGSIPEKPEDLQSPKCARLKKSLLRIRDIVRKIELVTSQGKIEKQKYSDESFFYKIHDE
ncbi:MAG: response regulator [Oligoflexales bacterium]